MVTKYCRKQPNIQQSRLLSANQKIEPVFAKVIFSVFWSVFCILCIHFFIFIQLFFHYYILLRYLKNVLCRCVNSEAYLEPSQTSKVELFAKIFNDQNPLTIFAKKVPLQMFDWILNISLELPSLTIVLLHIGQSFFIGV